MPGRQHGIYYILVLTRKDLRDDLRRNNVPIDEIDYSSFGGFPKDWNEVDRVDFMDLNGDIKTLKERGHIHNTKNSNWPAMMIFRPHSYEYFGIDTRLRPAPVMRDYMDGKVESPLEVEQFLRDYAALCLKYNLALSFNNREEFVVGKMEGVHLDMVMEARLQYGYLDEKDAPQSPVA